MIFPVKCFTCGAVIGDKYRYYKEQIRQRKITNGEDPSKVKYLTKNNYDKSIEGQILDELKITDTCCRIRFLTCIEI